MPKGVFERNVKWATPSNTKPNRKCTKCRKIKSREDFYIRRDGKFFRVTCKSCDRKMSKEWYFNNPERAKKANRKLTLLRNSGLTIEQYDLLLSSQGGVCAICDGKGNKRNLPVDHDHKTGLIRGILCDPCNKALGFLRDDIGLALKLITYLKNHSTKDPRNCIKINPKYKR